MFKSRNVSRLFILHDPRNDHVTCLGLVHGFVYSQVESLDIDPFPVPRVVDGTAAGDAFRAALAVALAEKQVGSSGCGSYASRDGHQQLQPLDGYRGTMGT